MTAPTLVQERVDVADDTSEFSAYALREGWSDGLPCIHPTEERVAAHVAASGLARDFAFGRLLPNNAVCTVELLAVNAVMAGAPPASMPLLCAAVAAIADPAFDLAGLNATTASVVPALIVNGPVRHDLDLPMKHSAFGGMAGPAPAIGRALRLVVRNVAGQVAGRNSESVFGQPARVTGIVVAEWEEESPWPSLAERRGTPGSAVTVAGVLGTANILNSMGNTGSEILELVAKSLAYMGNNNMDHASQFANQVVALNPIWARKVAAEFPSIDDVCEVLFKHARLPIEWFPTTLHAALEEAGDIHEDGQVWLMDSPDDVHVIVCGGMGSLHAAMMPGMSNMLSVTRSLDPASWESR